MIEIGAPAIMGNTAYSCEEYSYNRAEYRYSRGEPNILVQDIFLII
mgnify:CR=1 FL=1